VSIILIQASDIPGDFGTGYFGKSLEGEEKVEKLTKELQVRNRILYNLILYNHQSDTL
jgi:hypothetical protein